jgi:hypothetical protein
MSARKSSRKRVVALLNAIGGIHHGDLRAVLKLDNFTPLIDLEENDIKGRVRTGEALAHVLEDHLGHILGFGEVALSSSQKNSRGKEFGGKRF